MEYDIQWPPGEDSLFMSVAWVSSRDSKASFDIVPDRLVAVTLGNGGVKLMGFDRNSFYLVWNPWKHNLLAQGIDKPRNSREPAILIWDVTRSSSVRNVSSRITKSETNPPEEINSHNFTLPLASITSENETVNLLSTNTLIPIYDFTNTKPQTTLLSVSTCDKALCELGVQETTSSFAWLSRSSFITGMSGTYLKVFDLSNPNKPYQMTTTRAVYGLTVDPLCNIRIASFCERQISIWNLDNMEKPVYTFMESSNIQQIKWSPVRKAWLAVLVSDSCFVKLYDTGPLFSQFLEEPELAFMERSFYPSSRSSVQLVAFSWHPTIVNCLLTLDRNGCLDVAQVVENAAITWSNLGGLTWSSSNDWITLDINGFHTSNSAVLNEFLHLSKTKYKLSNSNQFLPRSGDLMNNEQAFWTVDLKQSIENDISSVMRKRAELGYGLNVNASSYADIVKDDVQLLNMWTWINYIQMYMDDCLIKRRNDVDTPSYVYGNYSKDINGRLRALSRCAGVIATLSESSLSPGAILSSEVLAYVEWQGIDVRLPFSRYRSPERSRVLRLCMWPLDDTDLVQRQVFERMAKVSKFERLKVRITVSYLDNVTALPCSRTTMVDERVTVKTNEDLCTDGQFERAAAMALINLKFDWALTFLNRASSDENSSLVALALAGYTDSNNDLWQTKCATLIKRIQNPYLRLMFVFLSRQGGDFDPILNDSHLWLMDRVAFACIYLNDDDLLSFVQSTCNQMIDKGNLEAILLTGLRSVNFVTLIQNYLNHTGDVQTAAIVALHACHLSMDDLNLSENSMIGKNRNAASKRPLLHCNSPRVKSLSSKKDLPLIVKLGGSSLANWVHSYRDLLDQWQMWFHRADFDIAYKSRILSDYVSTTAASGCKNSISNTSNLKSFECQSQTSTTPLVSQSGEKFTSFDLNTTGHPSSSMNTLSYLTQANSKVRSVGLVAAANQVFVACGFCGSRLGTQSKPNFSTPNVTDSVKLDVDMTSTGSPSCLQMHGGGGKLTICQQCRKPLPRCSICLMHLGTAAPLNEFGDAVVGLDRESARKKSALATRSPKISLDCSQIMQLMSISNDNIGTARTNLKQIVVPKSMADLFVWCQACRHGGHANHLTSWFYCQLGSDEFNVGTSKECPVSGCHCQCAELDLMQFQMIGGNYSSSSLNAPHSDLNESGFDSKAVESDDDA